MSTKFWVLSNEDSRARFFRARWAKHHKGRWISGINGWIWVPAEDKETCKPEKPKKKSSKKKNDN